MKNRIATTCQTYDIQRTWEENCERGPRFGDVDSAGILPDDKGGLGSCHRSFLGLPVRSRIGIAAGLLLNSRWILPYAARGFDILTYKTVRSVARPSYPLPNWVFVDEMDSPDGPAYVTDQIPDDPAKISSSVCFGMPSVAPEVWREDIAHCRRRLADGQLLIVSVVATPSDNPTISEIATDFAKCAAWAAEAGADVIEANLSCPNVCSAEGTLYHDAAASRAVAEAIRTVLGRVPLLLKVGTFAGAFQTVEFLHAVNGIANGVTLVNCISRPVLHRDGRSAFGEKYRTAGVLGRAIHRPSVAIVREVAECIRRDNLSLQIAAVGGASTVEDFADFLAAGANAVLCGSSPMYLPNLARDVKHLRPEW